MVQLVLSQMILDLQMKPVLHSWACTCSQCVKTTTKVLPATSSPCFLHLLGHSSKTLAV